MAIHGTNPIANYCRLQPPKSSIATDPWHLESTSGDAGPEPEVRRRR
jgi:hypothetical protein